MFSGSGNMAKLMRTQSDLKIDGKSKIVAVRSKYDITYNSAMYIHKATKFQRLYQSFPDRATRPDYCEDYPTCGYVENQRWWPVTGA